ncbi:MAG: hypothetical protein P4M09_08360 [Devosia sp.]|nr:hypothetical protein [Devosia sp.]
MRRLEATLRHVSPATAVRDDPEWQEASAADEEPPEHWVFEAICLQPQAPNASAPHRVLVGIEPELLGFRVQERAFWPVGQGVRARKFFAETKADAVVEAGRIAHGWLCRGYVVCVVSPS